MDEKILLIIIIVVCVIMFALICISIKLLLDCRRKNKITDVTCMSETVIELDGFGNKNVSGGNKEAHASEKEFLKNVNPKNETEFRFHLKFKEYRNLLNFIKDFPNVKSKTYYNIFENGERSETSDIEEYSSNPKPLPTIKKTRLQEYTNDYYKIVESEELTLKHKKPEIKNYIKKQKIYSEFSIGDKSYIFDVSKTQNYEDSLKETSYIAEVELSDKKFEIHRYYEDLFDLIDDILYVSKNVNIITPKSVVKNVISEYKFLINDELQFIGPDVLPLVHDHLDPMKSNNIFKNFNVTDKTDGMNTLLFVNSYGYGFLIDRNLNISDTGATFEIVNCIYNCEYLELPKNELYIFDCYFCNGHDMRDSEFDERHRMFKNIKYKIINKGYFLQPIKISAKTFFSGDIIKSANAIWDSRQNYPYKLDGLIFTNTRMPVPKNTKRWEGNLKWKPPNELTIDFLVKFVDLKKESKDKNEKEKKEIKDKNEKGKNENNFIKVQLKVANKTINNEPLEETFVNGECEISKICEDGDVIEDSTIVEFRYEENWIPTRIRYDKTENYHNKGILGSANFTTTANSVWETIQNPILLQVNGGKYYSSVGSDKTREFRKAHNIIKENLIQRAVEIVGKNDSPKVLDYGCGRFGDGIKFAKNGVKTYLGFDVDKENINNPDPDFGAISRYQNLSKKLPYFSDTEYKFYVADGAKDVNKQIRDKVMGKNFFNIINFQFTIHYFFDSVKTVEKLMKNIITNASSKSIVLITTFNGEKLDEELQKNNIVSDLYKIEKKYDKLSDVKNRINVKFETFEMNEYLVKPEYLYKIFDKAGFKLLESQNFNADIHDPELKKLSDFYRYYIFQKIQ